jgi:hypothetical protein
VLSSDTETLSGAPTFRVDINNGGQLQAATWQSANSFAASYSFTLSYSVPAGDLINSATLNLSTLVPVLVTPTVAYAGLAQKGSANQNPVWAADYYPNVGGTVSGTYLTITAGAVSRTINATSPGNLDLIALGFGSELASGTPIVIDWHQTLLLTANTNNFQSHKASWANVIRDFTVSGSVHDTAEAALTLDYSRPTPDQTPEPATYGLVGIGLLLLGRARRRVR